jgi:hypothetical protein
MRVEQFKRWHWAIIGLVLGLLFSFWGTWVGPEPKLIGRSTVEPSDFEKLLTQKSKSGQPMVRNIEVYRLGDGTYWLTAEQLYRRGGRADAPEEYVPVKIPARTPYVPALNPPAKVDPNYTVVDYLKAVKAKEPSVAFSTRWWAHEPVRTPIFALAGLLLIGGLFPPLVTRFGGAGTEADEKKTPEYDLSRFGKGKPQGPKPLQPQVTEQDIAHVRELDAELERRLAAARGGGAGAAEGAAAPGTPPGSSAPPQPVKPLSGGPLETSLDEKPKEQKAFDGEFYPTETHVKRKPT